MREETTYHRDDDVLPATLYYPARRGGQLPGWVALHGLTYHGREHPSLDRFARALAASGAAVLVPDLPEWRALRVAPERTVRTVKAAVLELDASGWTQPGRVGAIGFSFGATQSLIAATDPALEGHLAGVVAWGGYADFFRTTRFAFLGTHELDGDTHHLDPDPYGRWILAGNYLRLLPEHSDDDALADALLSLALEAGRRGIMSWSRETDAMKTAVAADLSPAQREVFDLIAAPVDHVLSQHERARVERLADRIAAAAADYEPLLDPSPYLGRVPVPVFLAHGRGDRLMPWTELPRLERSLPADRLAASAITSLFAHSFGEKRWPSPGVVVETVRFVRMIRRILNLI